MKNDKLTKWKIMILLSLILSLICFGIGIITISEKIPEYEHYFKYIHLENSNTILNLKVINYICTEGVHVNNIQSNGVHSFYASTWRDSPIHEGHCIIEYKVCVEKLRC